MTPKTVVLVMDQPWFSELQHGKPARANHSHDQHLFQFGHESLRKGFDVYIVSSREAREILHAYKIETFFPVLSLVSTTDAPQKPDFVVVVYPQSLALRTLYPNAKIIGILPAMIFLENPARPSARWAYGFLQSARTQVDFYLTQNRRMAELAASIFHFVARVDLRERILVCPLGLVTDHTSNMPPREQIRTEMGLGPQDIAFINAGGPWSWTDYNTCLQAFCNVVREGIGNIKFIIMGFKQPDNMDHDNYIAETKSILSAHADLIGRNIIVYENWQDASEKVAHFTFASDIGLNPNQDTAENWQSYRLRFLEYARAGIPAINTEGNDLSDDDARESIYPARSGNIQSYEQAMRLAAKDHDLRKKKAEAMRRHAAKLDSQFTYGRVIEDLDRMPPRDFNDSEKVFYPAVLAPPIAPISNWKEKKNETQASNEAAIWKNLKGWQDGDYPLLGHTLSLQAEQYAFKLNFILTVHASITANWPEIIQLGTRPELCHLIICAAAVDEYNYRLTLRFYDLNRKLSMFVSPDMVVGQTIKCGVKVHASKGTVTLSLDNKNYETHAKAWTPPTTDQIWIGSRTLPGIVEDITLYAFL